MSHMFETRRPSGAPVVKGGDKRFRTRSTAATTVVTTVAVVVFVVLWFLACAGVAKLFAIILP